MSVTALRRRSTTRRVPLENLAQLRQLQERAEREGSVSVNEARDAIRRLASLLPKEVWRFMLMNEAREAAVVDHLLGTPRPKQAIRVWGELKRRLSFDNQTILVERRELAAKLGCLPSHVSHLMADIEATGAIRSVKAGRRVRYEMNPWVATRLPLDESDPLRDEWPDLLIPFSERPTDIPFMLEPERAAA